ncbi:TIR domain-containing protein (plasmid) [Rhizobium leguminosarum]|nr:TIR domain-containing protein [Rhizobium leguminosarum]TAZ03385.1 TIR domain-containing protein [Rhizobium leguminosarum]
MVCTSAVGYGIEFGTKFAKSLRKHIEASDVLIAILSKTSLQSQFCAFEIGAAWGQNIPIKSVLLPSVDPSLLQRPLSSLNFHKWEDTSGWVQFIEEVAAVTENDLRRGSARLAFLSQEIAAFRA